MDQLTDEEIRKMSHKEAEEYLEAHPDEVCYFAKIYYALAFEQAKRVIRYYS